jgi:hypothetical protein
LKPDVSSLGASSLGLRRQWAILPADEGIRAGWLHRRLNRHLVLQWHPETRVRFVGDAGAVFVVIGIAVSLSAPEANLDDVLSVGPDCTDAATRRDLYKLGGIYVLLRCDRDTVHVYTDPAGMMGVYYGQGRAASTPSLLPNLERNQKVDREYSFRGSDDWYPGSLCPFHNVKALLANHCLDVTTGRIKRFWPTEAPKPISSYEGIERACDLLRGMIRGATAQGQLLVSLTGGRDSRVNLAASRDLLHEVHFFTVRSGHTPRCDIDYPAELARQFALDHRFIYDEPAPPAVYEMYDEIAGGMSVGGRREILGACWKLAAENYIHVNGNLGALTKGFYWHEAHPSDVKPDVFLKEFVSRSPLLRQAFDEWHATVPDLPPTTVYNLLYLEQRGGRWMGIGETAANLFYESFSPFCSRELFDVICGMPVEYQRDGRLLVEFVRHMWPELLDVPYCPAARKWGTWVPKRMRGQVKKLLKHVT